MRGNCNACKKRTKKIYQHVERLIKRCEWCKGRGWVNRFGGQTCGTCDGRGGEYETVRELVGEEVIE